MGGINIHIYIHSITVAAYCKAAPFRIRTPSLAATPVATSTAVGVARPKAHGHALPCYIILKLLITQLWDYFDWSRSTSSKIRYFLYKSICPSYIWITWPKLPAKKALQIGKTWPSRPMWWILKYRTILSGQPLPATQTPTPEKSATILLLRKNYF